MENSLSCFFVFQSTLFYYFYLFFIQIDHLTSLCLTRMHVKTYNHYDALIYFYFLVDWIFCLLINKGCCSYNLYICVIQVSRVWVSSHSPPQIPYDVPAKQREDSYKFIFNLIIILHLLQKTKWQPFAQILSFREL